MRKTGVKLVNIIIKTNKIERPSTTTRINKWSGVGMTSKPCGLYSERT